MELGVQVKCGNCDRNQGLRPSHIATLLVLRPRGCTSATPIRPMVAHFVIRMARSKAMTDIAKKHHVTTAWATVIARVRQELALRGTHPAHTVVLVPYAQLMQEAKNAWAASGDGAHFVPRFETTMNWTRSLGGFAPSGDDIRHDAALDVLTASSLLVRAGLAAHPAATHPAANLAVLAPRLMQAAWSLAGVAAAMAPSDRAGWGRGLGQALVSGMDSPILMLEAAVARIALAWASGSSYATDKLFDAQPGLLVVLQGFQAEPLARALQLRLGKRGVSLPLNGMINPLAGPRFIANPDSLALHESQDAEDEAQMAAACVLAHLAAGRCPVALVAVDRVLTRRVRAMLAGKGLAVRDETGWTLSTTRAAASLMGLLRACAWDASTDAVLDWLKNAPAFSAHTIDTLETEWRKAGLREWRWLSSEVSAADDGLNALKTPHAPSTDGLVTAANAVRHALQASRPLCDWLHALREALQVAGQWARMVADDAGQAVLQALCLAEDQQAEIAEFSESSTRMALHDFTAWASQTLEAKNFMPTHPADAQVVVLPLTQLLGRPLTAVVLPGCDEVRLPMSPEPSGQWTPAQSALLGLPSRQQIADNALQAWQYALQSPKIDVVWRSSEGGERLMPSGFVQTLLLSFAPVKSAGKPLNSAPDPRVLRALVAKPCTMPQPRGDALPVTRLSASAYEDLRRCPYRFFALRQLKLQESDELDTSLSKRDFGNWLHHLLHRFHEALMLEPIDVRPVSALAQQVDREALIDLAADEAAVALGLSTSEFLPFAAAWPKVRAGYLEWLDKHEASGATYSEGEVWKETPLGAVTLFGKLDRVDRLADGSALVIDYKTEGKAVSAERIKAGAEDTQLAFYAALLQDDLLAAAYVNVGEKDATKAYLQTDIGFLRDQLIEGIVDDMARIRGGAAMPALGEGTACDFCAARGLCRKDFWTV